MVSTEMKIEKTGFKNADGYRLTCGELAAVVTEYGGKIQSLQKNGCELLWQNRASGDYRFSAYGDVFETGEMSGFDDMFPNIAAGLVPDGFFRGVALPDHGEVWSQRWDCVPGENGLTLTAHGVRLPYAFSKTIRMDEGGFSVDYAAENLCEQELPFLWAAHPLFALEPGTRLEIPDCREIMNVYGGQKYLGPYGEHHDWPVSKDGRDLRTLSPEEKCCTKYYVWNPLRENRAEILRPDGIRIAMTAPVDAAPYLGVWYDEDGGGTQCVAPEPCTAAFDSLHAAALFGRDSRLAPRETRRWTLRVAIDG